MFAFFNDLHTDLNVAIEKRENFDATTDRETISAQNMSFLDVSTDKNSDKVIDDSTTNWNNEKNDEMTD